MRSAVAVADEGKRSPRSRSLELRARSVTDACGPTVLSEVSQRLAMNYGIL